MRRASVAMEKFIREGRLQRSRFSIAAEVSASRNRFGGKAFLEITLLNRKVDQ
jgi:hypothetical protein